VLFLVPAYGAYFIIYSFVFNVSNLKSVICCDEPCVVPSLTGEPCFTAFFRRLVFFGHCIFVLKTKCSECQSWSLANTEIDVLISGQNRRNIWLYNSEADNASNNNTLVDELAEMLDRFQGSLTRVRCFAHILNLVVKVFILYNTSKTSH
jgi:hypothetical protein